MNILGGSLQYQVLKPIAHRPVVGSHALLTTLAGEAILFEPSAYLPRHTHHHTGAARAGMCPETRHHTTSHLVRGPSSLIISQPRTAWAAFTAMNH
jgi:hypothetical protein